MFSAVKTTSIFARVSRPLHYHSFSTSMFPAATKMPATRSRRSRPKGPPAVRSMASNAAATAPAPQAAPAPAAAPSSRDESHFSARRFADAPISEASKKGIKHEHLSDVQAATLDYALSGLDLLVQAKTGTGKTLAFLLPAVERLAKMELVNRKISMLVLSPTRELALQIEEEAHTLIANHPFKVSHAIGGTNMNASAKRIQENPPRILIATPGRLVDHLENTPGFVHLFSDLKVIVYDEADRLLDQGFRRELDKILGYLPDKTKVKRQALLFSATVSEEIKGIAKGALAANYKFVSTLRADEINTHEHVPQQSMIVPFSQHLAATLSFLQQDRVLHNGISKAIIFLPTARLVGFYYEALSHLPQGTLPKLFEIHSRKSQPARIKAADQFKDSREGVLISSDVTARGMDFPGVTLILQPGLPPNSEQYIHRLGRTARAGASGRGIVILDQAESFFLRDKTISGLGITPIPQVATPGLYHLNDADLQTAFAQTQQVLPHVSTETKGQAYRAFLGVYNTSQKSLRWTRDDLVAAANEFAVTTLGWTEPELPEIDKRTIGKMNLKGVQGLNIVSIERPPRGQPGGSPVALPGDRLASEYCTVAPYILLP
ncbi:P-loop containing nucleoside triphosphate hydrolase protein [Mycena maculata]|uniref:ATP-dependent RNA helicase n=1 Tax=Mycena maculata TaxID=230809 RepID=A0AAD7IXU7_9AGAR|nr:P-loop containing nucleoside triphosphate hydrolase protein [Mycena maculata]